MPQGVNPADFIETDPVSGDRVINEQKLNARIEELSTRASRAENAVSKYIETSEQREIERQNREAFNAYPELNPSAQGHDVTFHNQTRAVIYDSVLNPQDYGGRPLSFKDAADYVQTQRTRLAGSTAQIPQGSEIAQEHASAQELKQQAAASPTGEQVSQRQSEGDQAELARLRQATRLGNEDALAARLAHTEHIVQKT
jgi:hypothetical protein